LPSKSLISILGKGETFVAIWVSVFQKIPDEATLLVIRYNPTVGSIYTKPKVVRKLNKLALIMVLGIIYHRKYSGYKLRNVTRTKSGFA